jgi:hypothetical protein
MTVDRVRNALRERIAARARDDDEPRRARLREVEGVRSALGRVSARRARRAPRAPGAPAPRSAAPRTAR